MNRPLGIKEELVRYYLDNYDIPYVDYMLKHWKKKKIQNTVTKRAIEEWLYIRFRMKKKTDKEIVKFT